MFGHAAMMFKKGCCIDTGDMTNGASEGFADLQASVETDNDGQEDQDDTGGATGGENADAEVADQRTSKQDPETDAAFAKMRRELERYKKELEARDKWVAEKFGQTHGITTWDQYQAAVGRTLEQQQTQQQAEMELYREQRERELEEQGYNVKEIREIFRNDPAFQQMVQENQYLKQQIQEEQKLRETDRIVQQIQKDHQYLRQKYGDLVPENLDELDDEVKENMRQGMPLRAAWLLANEDKVLESAKTRTQQNTLRNVNSKSHLGTEKSGGPMDTEPQVDIPPEKLAVWRALGYSDKEAKKREIKYLKKQRVAK